VFDMLTRDELCTLHTTLYQGGMRAHFHIIDSDTGAPLVPPLSPEWDLYAAVHAELAEAMEAVDAELDRRDAEAKAMRWGLTRDA
jgi:hypothetical protein